MHIYQIHIVQGTANITYALKLVTNSSYIDGEETNTKAITESLCHISYIRNPTPGIDDDKDKLEINLKTHLNNVVYINIIAKIQQNNIIK